MVNLTDHATCAWSILNLNNLRNLLKTERLESTLLVDRSSNLALNLLDFYCCHCINLQLSVKHFIHAYTTLTSDSVCVTHLSQSLNGSLNKVVSV